MRRKNPVNDKILLSADSTCDLGDELKARYKVEYFPLHIILDGKDYRDNVDIDPATIFEMYRKKGILPQTSAINEEEYIEYFTPFVEQGYEIVHLNLASTLSSAHENAVAAAKKLPGVYPIDSHNLSTGIGLQIIAAGDLIASGMPACEVVERVKALRTTIHSSFILDTLDFMRAGGRCSGAAALVSSKLKIKPCIEVNNMDGSMTVGKKYHGHLDKVLTSYVIDKLAAYDDILTDHIFVTSCAMEPKLVEHVRKTVLKEMPFKEVHETRASCTIGSHCGPNTLGILFMTGGSCR